MAYGKVRVDQIQSSTRTVDVDDLATTDTATQSVPGLLSAADKTKLDGIAAGAEVNVNADWNAGSGDAQILNKPTIGTSAGNLVQLDGSARLPAVDGSQLTGINAATNLTYTAATRVIASSTGTDATLTLVTSSDAGLAPASGGGTTNFLRADGTWAPAGSPPAGSDTQIQFNDGGAFGGDVDLTYNKTTNLLTTKGDVRLDDGGTFTTTIQTVTATANRTISYPDATGTVALVAGSSQQFIYNNAGAYAGVSTMTFDGTSVTLAGRLINSYTSLASSPAKVFTGAWATGFGATNTKPHFLIEPSGTTSTGWSNSGTGLGVNAASGFAGNLLDLQVNGTSNFAVQAGVAYTLDSSYGLRRNSSAVTSITGGSTGQNIIDLNSTLVQLNAIRLDRSNQDIVLLRDAAGILAQRNGTAAQTFRVYNTYTSSTNYERAKLEWSSNVLRIGTEKGSAGGTARDMELQTDGTTRVTVKAGGAIIFSGIPTSNPNVAGQLWNDGGTLKISAG
jgi:hypothetical protein